MLIKELKSRSCFLFLLLLSAVAIAPAETVRVGVFGLFRPSELRLSPAPGNVLILVVGSRTHVLEGTGSPPEARIEIAGDQIRMAFGSEVLLSRTIRASSRDGAPAEFFLAVPGKIRRRFQGSLEIRMENRRLVPVVSMDLEAAVASAVAAESPPGAPPEALKAQAVATRSYFVAGRGRHTSFDFCDTTHCQFLREAPGTRAPSFLATTATRGIVLTYGQKPFAALYSASCGGRTRTLAELGIETRDYPYFPVACSYCQRHASAWRTELSSASAAPLLKSPSEGSRVTVGRKLGWSAVPSNSYELRREGERVIIEGGGHGHGVGLCQRGASGMAAVGADFQTILEHYYPNTTLMLRSGPFAGRF